MILEFVEDQWSLCNAYWTICPMSKHIKTIGERDRQTSTFSSPTASENLTMLDTRGSFVRRYTSWKTLNPSTPTNVLYNDTQKCHTKLQHNYKVKHHNKSQISLNWSQIMNCFEWYNLNFIVLTISIYLPNNHKHYNIYSLKGQVFIKTLKR